MLTSTTSPAQSLNSDRTISSPTHPTYPPHDSCRHESQPLPPGCKYGYLPTSTQIPSTPSETPAEHRRREEEKSSRAVIWVDFAPSSSENPFFFSIARKRAILIVAIFFTGMTAFNTSAYSIGEGSMSRDLGLSSAEASAGLSLYAWGFGIAPLALAPLSEEFGRKWTCIVSVFIYWQCHLFMTLGKNLPTILVGRFIQGAAGSVGATLVGGTISDIYVPHERGIPMAAFGAVAIGATGLGPVVMAWVEANTKLEWRWIQWIQYIIMGAYFPLICIILCETRATVILRRKAHKFRHTMTGFSARFTAKSEIEKVKFTVALQQSLLRPITFLLFEPVVTFFSLWVGLAWGVFYIQIAGLPYVYQNIFGFDITSVGLIYIAIVLGAVVGFGLNLSTESLYQRKREKRGVEARLYTPMAAGVAFAIGCFIFAFTATPDVHWIGPCFGIVIIIASVLIIYICNFTYLSECYGSYASSAIAAQSFTRNIFGGAFTFLTKPLFNNLTVRWGLFLFGCLSAILAVVPFVAFWRGPQIRARSKYSRQLMAEEAMRIELEKNGEDDSGDGAYEGQQGEEDGDGGEPLQQRVAEQQRDGELPGVKRETEASARADNARPKT